MRNTLLLALLAIPTVAHCDVMAGVLVGRQNIAGYGFPAPHYDVDFSVLIDDDGQLLQSHIETRLGLTHYVGLARPVSGTITPDGYDLVIHDVPRHQWPNQTIDLRVTPTALQFPHRTYDVTVDASQIAEVGDSNLDGLFSSADLVQVMQFGKYERRLDTWANWRMGDWNVDGYFDSGDLVEAFQAGTYEKPSPVVVPEPSAMVLTLVGCLLLLWHRSHSDPRARIAAHRTHPSHRLA